MIMMMLLLLLIAVVMLMWGTVGARFIDGGGDDGSLVLPERDDLQPALDALVFRQVLRKESIRARVVCNHEDESGDNRS